MTKRKYPKRENLSVTSSGQILAIAPSYNIIRIEAGIQSLWTRAIQMLIEKETLKKQST